MTTPSTPCAYFKQLTTPVSTGASVTSFTTHITAISLTSVSPLQNHCCTPLEIWLSANHCCTPLQTWLSDSLSPSPLPPPSACAVGPAQETNKRQRVDDDHDWKEKRSLRPTKHDGIYGLRSKDEQRKAA